jgi:hypothetical protein
MIYGYDSHVMACTVPDEEEHRSQVTATFDATLGFQMSHVTAEADVGGQPFTNLVIKIYTVICVLCIRCAQPPTLAAESSQANSRADAV